MGKNRRKANSLPDHRDFFSQPNGRHCDPDRPFNAPIIKKGNLKNKTQSRENICHSYQTTIFQDDPRRTPKT
jgi:hypothetical protein